MRVFHQDTSVMGITIARIFKVVLIIVGTISLAIGIVGIFLPILPTTPFLLLSAACYAAGSEKFYVWLINNRIFGNYIRNYREGKGIDLKLKILSIASMWIAIGYSAYYVVPFLAGKLALIVIVIGVTAHILTIPTLKSVGISHNNRK